MLMFILYIKKFPLYYSITEILYKIAYKCCIYKIIKKKFVSWINNLM